MLRKFWRGRWHNWSFCRKATSRWHDQTFRQVGGRLYFFSSCMSIWPVLSILVRESMIHTAEAKTCTLNCWADADLQKLWPSLFQYLHRYLFSHCEIHIWGLKQGHFFAEVRQSAPKDILDPNCVLRCPRRLQQMHRGAMGFYIFYSKKLISREA